MNNDLPVRVSTVLSGQQLTRLYRLLDDAREPFSLRTCRMPRNRSYYVELRCRPCDAVRYQKQINNLHDHDKYPQQP